MSQGQALWKQTRVGAFSALLAFAAIAAQPSQAGAQSAPISEQEAHAIGVDAYLYFYPLVSMDLTRRQMTNVPAGKELGFGPPNTFNNTPEYPSASDRAVVRPNFDTLYSIAWLDLTKEPVIVSAPDTNGRYYMLPMLDMWTDVKPIVLVCHTDKRSASAAALLGDAGFRDVAVLRGGMVRWTEAGLPVADRPGQAPA